MVHQLSIYIIKQKMLQQRKELESIRNRSGGSRGKAEANLIYAK
jgi:hypothetical protein